MDDIAKIEYIQFKAGVIEAEIKLKSVRSNCILADV